MTSLGIVYQAQARPVSYPGGWTVMQKNDTRANSLHVHYSPNARYSLGYRGVYWREKSWQFHGTQLNYLASRWNQPASQANLYIKSGVGLAYSDSAPYDQKIEPSVFANMAFDWENRRFFISYENLVYHAGEIDRFFSQKSRAGIAPYLGDYEDVHTWLMLQIDHSPESKNKVVLTPFLRFFKSYYMSEIGISNDGDIMFNVIIRF